MNNLTKIQIACQTKLTRDGVRDMTNRKPYRTAAQKIVAKQKAHVVDGRYVSSAPVSTHKGVK